jgi:hypothetical protein
MDLSGEELDMMAGMEADISYSATAHLRRAGPATRLSTEQLKAKDGRLRNYYDTAGTATASLRSAFGKSILSSLPHSLLPSSTPHRRSFHADFNHRGPNTPLDP